MPEDVRATAGVNDHGVEALDLALNVVGATVATVAPVIRDAMGRALAASEAVGVRAMLVHAIDERARAFNATTASSHPPPTPSTL